MPRHEFRRVLEHVDEPVQLAQHVVGKMARSPSLAVEIYRYLGVAEAYLFDERAQVHHRGIELGSGREFLVIDRQNERRRARLLLGKLRQVAVAGHAQDFHALLLDRRRERADAQPRSVFRAEIFIDDDDWEAELHGCGPVPDSPAVAGGDPVSRRTCVAGWKGERRELCGDSERMATAAPDAPPGRPAPSGACFRSWAA